MLNVGEFLHSLPERVNPAAIEGQSTNFHFNINDEGVYTVQLDNGRLTVQEGLQGDPECIVTASAETFSKVITGDLNPMMAMMTGKLKINNPGVMLKYAKIFGIM